MFEPSVGSIAIKTIDNQWPMRVARRAVDGWMDDRGNPIRGGWAWLMDNDYDLIREGWV